MSWTDLSIFQALRLVGCKYQDHEGGWDISGCDAIVKTYRFCFFSFFVFRLSSIGSTRSSHSRPNPLK